MASKTRKLSVYKMQQLVRFPGLHGIITDQSEFNKSEKKKILHTMPNQLSLFQ